MYTTAQDIPNGLGWFLLTDSQDVAHVLESIGLEPDDYASVFVRIEGGDYDAVYGCHRQFPKDHNPITQLV